MRFWRWSHVVALAGAAFVAATASADVNLAPSVPEPVPGPAVFAVTPFENHVPNGKSFEWIVAEAPFEIAAKIAGGVRARPRRIHRCGSAPRCRRRPIPSPRSPHSSARRYVITGWFDKIGEELRIAILVWKIDRGHAVVVGDAKRQGAVPTYHVLLGGALGEAWQQAKVAPAHDRRRPDDPTHALAVEGHLSGVHDGPRPRLR